MSASEQQTVWEDGRKCKFWYALLVKQQKYLFHFSESGEHKWLHDSVLYHLAKRDLLDKLENGYWQNWKLQMLGLAGSDDNCNIASHFSIHSGWTFMFILIWLISWICLNLKKRTLCTRVCFNLQWYILKYMYPNIYL